MLKIEMNIELPKFTKQVLYIKSILQSFVRGILSSPLEYDYANVSRYIS